MRSTPGSQIGCALILGIGLALLLAILAGACATEAAPSEEPLPAPSDVDLALSTAGSLTIPFPRLGMWWPDTWEQPLADIARYDWVIFGDWDRENVPQIKALNPDLLALNSTNACELSYDPAPDAPSWDNEDVLAIPPQWFLTQVGTTLTVDVDATTTTFPVAAVTTTDGTTVYPLFVVSDTVLVEGESVLVEGIDAQARTLTVRRGYVRPAAPHAAGTRVAAHVTFWPQSWVLNLSTLCPPATVSSTIGSEIWADYNARRAIDLLADPIWDGILLDRSDPDQSWLIGNSTARTIDPDQSNALLTDYADFDAAWNAGIRRYEENLRAAVGDERLIFVNWGMANYDLLNGNNFEGFPMDDGSSYGRPWATTVFGPAEDGSYFEWMAQAQQPNLTMIETYEDDGGPDPTGDGGYDNPCDDPHFVPDYRKMRFGLATALLNDGFFSYEINTNGHGSLCLLWFDEYDNAGAGRGYLGQPLGSARRALPDLSATDLVTGGGFETGDDLAAWDLWADTDAGYSATVALDPTTAASGTRSARIDVLQAQGTDWRVEFTFAPVEVVSGTDYTLSFWARADRDRPIGAWVQQDEDPWTGYIWFDSFPLTTDWAHFAVTLPATGSDPVAAFRFGLGEAEGTVWLDGVALRIGLPNVWRRDYAGGVALANASSTSQTVPLGGVFRHISGTQAPEINDGRRVTEVTLAPLDGVVLLRRMVPQVYLPLVLRTG
jgi:hypothetical protein